MPIKHPFKVRKNKDTTAVEFKIELPTSLADKDLIVQRYGTVERLIDRANAQLTVDVAPGIRKRLPNAEVAKTYVDGYCDNGSRDPYVVPKITVEEAKAQGFSVKNIEFLREQGVIS